MPKFNESNFLKVGLSMGDIEWLRSVDTVTSPSTISFDVTEIESLLHEFRLLRNELDVLRASVQEASIEHFGPPEILSEEEYIHYAQPLPVTPRMYAYSTSVNVTAKENEFIAATKKLTVKLPDTPSATALVTVLNVNGNEITVSGNGNTINGETKTVSTRKNTTINYYWFADLDSWYMR